MDALKKKFDSNKPEQQTPLGHEARFLKKLSQKDEASTKPFLNKYKIGMIAAMLTGLVLISYTFYEMGRNNQLANKIQIEDYNPAIANQHSFLKASFEKRKNEIDLLRPELEAELEMLNQLEAEYQVLSGHFDEGRVNQALLEALIKNYGLRLKLLETISKKIEILNQQKHIKIDNHEKS